MDDAEREAWRSKREIWAAENVGRQTAVMEDLANRAHDTLGRLAVARQARSHHRYLARWNRSKAFGRIDRSTPHLGRLRAWQAAAATESAERRSRGAGRRPCQARPAACDHRQAWRG